MEETLVIIKPDAVRRKLVGEILSRFEEKGLSLKALEQRRLSPELASALYDIHQGKDFFDGLVRFITSGEVVVLVLEGEDAISQVRAMVGATDPKEAAPGSIRGDYALSIEENIIHAADSRERAETEMALFF